MGRRRSLQYGFLLGLLISVVGFFAGGADEGPGRGLSAILPDFGGDPEDPVWVFVVEDPRAVANVRRAVADERVVYASDEVVAVAEGRVVAVDHDAVGRAINALGWIDREIELFEMPGSRFEAQARTSGDRDAPERRAKLSALVKKERLSYADQVLVLQAMNDGVAF